MKYTILILTFIFSVKTLACMQFPKRISLKNSKLPISEFRISGSSFSFNDPEDQKEANLVCNAEKNEWTLTPYNFVINKENVDTVKSIAITNKSVAVMRIKRSSEITCSQINNKICIPSQVPTLEITLPNSDNERIIISCDSSSPSQQTVSAHIISNSKSIANVSSTVDRSVRGIHKDLSSTIDLSSSQLQELHYSGCTQQGTSTSGRR